MKHNHPYLWQVVNGWRVAANSGAHSQMRPWFCCRDIGNGLEYDRTADGKLRKFASPLSAAKRRDALARAEGGAA